MVFVSVCRLGMCMISQLAKLFCPGLVIELLRTGKIVPAEIYKICSPGKRCRSQKFKKISPFGKESCILNFGDQLAWQEMSS